MKLNNDISIRLLRRGCGMIATMALAGATLTMDVYADTVLADFTFEAGLSGWTGMACPGVGVCALAPGGPVGAPPFTHAPSGGSDLGPFPGGGNLEGIDPGEPGPPGTPFTVLAVAPGTMTSALAPDLWLSFDLKINGVDFNNDLADVGPIFADLVPLFYIAKGGDVIVYAVPEAAAIPALGDWEHYEVPLVANAEQGGAPGLWYTAAGPDVSGAAFDSILDGGGPLDMLFWLELTKDAPDVDGAQLDNVSLVMHMVPIPAALPLMMCALAGLGFAGRRRV